MTLFSSSFLNALQKSRTLLSNYWTRLNNIDVLYNSMLSDPRFKHQRLKNNVKKEEFLTIFENKREILKDSILKQSKNDSSIADAISYTHNMCGKSSNILLSQDKCSEQLLYSQFKSNHSNDLELFLKEELDKWLCQYKTTYDDDVLAYWETHKDDYSLLSRYVLYIFDIPCSSVAVERFFSIGRNVYGVRRSLKAKSAESVIFLTFNSKN